MKFTKNCLNLPAKQTDDQIFMQTIPKLFLTISKTCYQKLR